MIFWSLDEQVRPRGSAVNDSEAARQVWRDAAARGGAGVRFVLLAPPETCEHQRRLGARQRGLQHLPESSWSQGELRAEEYEVWRDEPIEVSADETVQQLVRRLEQELPLGRADRTP